MEDLGAVILSVFEDSSDDELEDNNEKQPTLDQEEKEVSSAPPPHFVNTTNNARSIAEPRSVPTFFVKPTSESKCGNCGKVFNTSLRFDNHQKHCNSNSNSSNSRLQQLRTHWAASESLMSGRERCNKCGRVDYPQDDLASHLADRTRHQCRGTLHLLPRFKCLYCSQPRRFTTEQSLRNHINAKHAKEAMDDVTTWQSKL